MTVLTIPEQIFDHGNKHMMEKLRAFGSQGQAIIKYIISKLRKYHGSFFESNSTISKAVGCSVRTVQNTVKKAEQLNIFAVSPRKELDELTGKIRQTTNLIQLLAYAPLKKVKKVIVEAVREVKNKAQVVVEKVRDTTPKGKNKPNTSQKQTCHGDQIQNQYKGQYPGKKAPLRNEVLPDWWEESDIYYEKQSVKEDETYEEKKRSMEEILADLKKAGI
ncbi:MAG: helix-turn-helix domain-containing protein [Bacillota bacterium]|nr:helix-turn-helix domain-containing protein [Bacillota bacterium]